MPLTPAATAHGVAGVHPVARTPSPGGSAIANRLQHVQNAQALVVGPPPGSGAGAWRPWAAPGVPAAASAWRPWEASEPDIHGTRPVGIAFDTLRETALVDLLAHVSRRLLIAVRWVAGAGGDKSFNAFSQRFGLKRPPYEYADQRERQLTPHGRKILEVWSAVLDLARSGYGDSIPRSEFEAFARSRNLDAYMLARHLGLARNHAPDGLRRFPQVQSAFEHLDSVESLRSLHAAALANPPPAFLRHLALVNKTLEVALRWVRSSQTSRPAPSLNAFAARHGAGCGIRTYVQTLFNGESLTHRGVSSFAYELAAFDWIQRGRPYAELRDLASARGLSEAQITWYATRALTALQSHDVRVDPAATGGRVEGTSRSSEMH